MATLLSSARAEPARAPRGTRLKAFWFERDSVADRLDFGLATDRLALDGAFRLQHDQYVAQGYMDPHPSGRRLSLHNALPSTVVFVALDADRVVATVAVIIDSPLGLPMAEIYADELQESRRVHHRLAEVSGLAVHPNYQKSGLAILLRLIRLVLLYAIEMAEVKDLCIAINPHHQAFYRKAFGFESIGGLKQYGKVNGAPALAMRLDLDVLRTFIAELRDGLVVESDVYSFLFHPRAVELAMSRLETDLATVFPRWEDLSLLFSGHEAVSKASPGERAYVEACWQSRPTTEPVAMKPRRPAQLIRLRLKSA